jgi:hypothetical protein
MRNEGRKRCQWAKSGTIAQPQSDDHLGCPISPITPAPAPWSDPDADQATDAEQDGGSTGFALAHTLKRVTTKSTLFLPH